MTTRTTYIADDGSEFSEELACLNYEALCKEVSEIMSVLQPHPTDVFEVSAWEQGWAYIRHDADAFDRVAIRLDRFNGSDCFLPKCLRLARLRIANTKYLPEFREYREWYSSCSGGQGVPVTPLPNPNASKP